MIKNFFLVAYRTMTRQLTYSIINIAGLSIGIACSLVIFLFVYGEWSYDRGFAKSDRTYKVGVSFFNMNLAVGPERFNEDFPSQFAGVEAATRVRKDGSLPIELNGQITIESNAFYTDSSFFRIFDHQFLVGNPDLVLLHPGEMVLTEELATKYFGNTDVIGKTLNVGKERKQFVIVGVVKQNDFNATVKGNLFLSIYDKLQADKQWTSAAYYNYILLHEGVSMSDMERAVNTLVEKTVYPELSKNWGIKTFEDYQNNANTVKFHIQPLHDIYLRSTLSFEMIPGGNEANIYIFSAISIFILALAAVNFINLTTARASRRAKEVGIRKTMGTSRASLIAQFLVESVVVSLMAMVIAIVLSEIFLATFQWITGTALLTTIWKNPITVMAFLGFSVVVGICSGIYPAFYLTSFKPVKTLKGNLMAAGGGTFRNVLVVFQFSVSIVLIICAAVVQQQLHYVQTRELGFDQENVLTIDRADLLEKKLDAFREKLLNQTGVLGYSGHTGEPGSQRWLSFSVYQTPELKDGITISTYFGDDQYIDLMGMKIIQGRTFNRNLASDTASIVLNQAAVAALGLGEKAIGSVLNNTDKVIGVVSNFHWESLRNNIAPLAIKLGKTTGELSFKLEPGRIRDFVATAEAEWKALAPDDPFKYHFVDENFGEMLQKEEVFGKAINFFTLLAIFVSCLGLYGLSAYTAEQRTKEIGIRKVMGASASQIVIMLNRKFTTLVVISVFIGVPAAFYAAQQWLQGFAYRIELGPGVFAIAVGLAILLAWATVSFHSIRASWINPADTLKYE